MTEAQQINHLQQQLDDARQSLSTACAMAASLEAENRRLTAELAAERDRNQPSAWRMGARRSDSAPKPLT